MNLDFFNRGILKVFFSCTLLVALFFGKAQIANASSISGMSNSQDEVIEHLRLKVPKEYQQAWLSAERASWEPWLNTKSGFVRRNLFWDKKNEEATILITWSTRQQWKDIPQFEIDMVQEKFVDIAGKEIGDQVENPFPLTFQGELLPQ